MRAVVRAGAVAGALAVPLAVPAPAIGGTDDGLRPGQVVTIAGTGERGYSGDGGDARDARLESSLSIDVAPDGTVYIADAVNNRVRAVAPDGTIDTLMEIDLPLGVTVDGTGTVYIAARYQIVRLDPDGSSTVIGGPDEPADFWESADGGDGPAAEARMHQPSGIAAGPDGTVYVADGDNRQIRAIDTGGQITTVAGGGEREAGDAHGRPATDTRITPAHVAADSQGGVYFTQEEGHTVWRVDGDGTLTAFAGSDEPGFSGDGGPATEAQLDDRLGGLHVAGDGAVYVADRRNGHVRRIGADGIITTAGPWFDRLKDVSVGPDGHLYVVDDYQVKLVARGAEPPVDPPPPAPDRWADEQPGTVVTVAGTGEPPEQQDDTSLASELADWPRRLEPVRSLAGGPDGRLYYAVSTAHRVLGIGPDGTVDNVAGTGERGFSGDGGPATGAALASPSGIAVGPDGTLYIADRGNGRIRAVDTTGTIRTVAGTQAPDFDRDYREEQLGDGGPATDAEFGEPADVAVGDGGQLYIADTGARRIRMVDPDGTIDTIAGGGDRWAHRADDAPATEANLWHPETVAVDPDGNVYFLESERSYVRMVDTGGILRTVAGDSRDRGSYGEAGYAGDGGPASEAALNNPRRLAVAPDGTLHIADAHNGRVRAVDADGVITTVAGTGERRDTGDGGAAADAAVDEPVALAFDAGGNLYLAGSSGHLLRRVDTSGTISTVVDLTAGGAETGVGAGTIATETALGSPHELAVDPSGVLYIGDFHTGRLHAVRPDGTIRTVADHPAEAGPVWQVAAVAAAGDGSLYVARDAVYRLYPDGAAALVAGGSGRIDLDDQPPEPGQVATTARLYVTGLAAGPDGELHLTDQHRIYRLEPDGSLTTLGEIGGTPSGLTAGPDGTLHLAVEPVAGAAAPTGAGAGEPTGTVAGVVVHPASGIAVDTRGTIYLSTWGAIRRLDPDDTVTTVYRPQGQPGGLAVDAHGNLYFTEPDSHRVRVLVRPADLSSPTSASAQVRAVLAAGIGALLLVAAGLVGYRRRRAATGAADPEA